MLSFWGEHLFLKITLKNRHGLTRMKPRESPGERGSSVEAQMSFFVLPWCANKFVRNEAHVG